MKGGALGSVLQMMSMFNGGTIAERIGFWFGHYALHFCKYYYANPGLLLPNAESVAEEG